MFEIILGKFCRTFSYFEKIKRKFRENFRGSFRKIWENLREVEEKVRKLFDDVLWWNVEKILIKSCII